MVDYLGTIILSFIFAFITNISLVNSTIIMFILSIILHSLFGVEIHKK